MDNNDNSANPGSGSQISAYRAPKIPPFWRDDPETWFSQVEASFRTANITVDRTKADFLISTLESEVAKHIRDLVNANPPPENLYQKLKDRILSAFSTSSEARLRQLLKGQPLGGRKPSHLLTHMRQLNGNQCSTAVLKSLFIEQLPESLRAILTVVNEPDLQKLAEIADKIVERSDHDLALVPVQKQPARDKTCSSLESNDLSDIKSKLTELTKRFASLENKVVKMKRERSRSNSRSSNSKQIVEKSGLCYIHQKYGTKATSCRKPCTWKDDENKEN